VIKVTKDHNDLPALDGISDVHGPGTLVVGSQNPDYNRLKVLNFGDYVQTRVTVDPTNTNEARTVGAIDLYPSGYGQGSWYFMSLATGERIHRYQWTVIPIAEETINLVHALAREQQMPKVNGNFVYEFKLGEEMTYDEGEGDIIDIIEENYDEDHDNHNNDKILDDEVNSNDGDYVQAEDNSNEDDNDLSDEDFGVEETGAPEITDVDEMVNDNSDISMEPEEINDVVDMNNDHAPENDDKSGAPVVDNDDITNDMNNAVTRFELRRSLRHARNARYNYRNRFEREFQYLQKSVENIHSTSKIKKKTRLNVKDGYRWLVGIMMNLLSKDDEFAQVGYKEGTKRHGEKAVEAMFKEACQLGDSDKEEFIPMDASKI